MDAKEKDDTLRKAFSRDFVKNKKHHKEVKQLTGDQRNECSRIKDGEWRVLSRKDEVRGSRRIMSL